MSHVPCHVTPSSYTRAGLPASRDHTTTVEEEPCGGGFMWRRRSETRHARCLECALSLLAPASVHVVTHVTQLQVSRCHGVTRVPICHTHMYWEALYSTYGIVVDIGCTVTLLHVCLYASMCNGSMYSFCLLHICIGKHCIVHMEY